MRRRVLVIAASVARWAVVGVAVTAAITALAALARPPSDGYVFELHDPADEASWRRAWLPAPMAEHARERGAVSWSIDGFHRAARWGMDEDVYFLMPCGANARPIEPAEVVSVYRLRAGWPLRCVEAATFRGGGFSYDVTVGGWDLPHSKRYGWIAPRGVMWTGFAINSIVAALAMWIVFALPFRLRAWSRRRHGRCLRCAHVLAGAQTCPECGLATPALGEAIRNLSQSPPS